jgi:ethanolamine utilization protein EutJ
VHLSLVLAGNYKISYEQAEAIKTDRNKTREILPVVRPVIEKIASIVDTGLQKFDDLTEVCLVGGTCELDGFAEIVQKSLRMRTFRPDYPRFTTPLGIALSCLDAV